MTGAIAMGSSKITGLADGAASGDAINKGQLDLKLNLAGGTMTGDIAIGSNVITSSANPTADTHLARKAYVDSILGSSTSAATSAATATTKASEASTSASNAATSVTAAATSATNAAASYDSFDDRYLGTKSSDPTVDNDGDALVAGALYFNTTSNAMKVYTGSAWSDVAPTATSITASQISDVSSTAAELNLNDGSSAGTIVNSKTVVYGSAGEVNATTLQIGGTSITSTAAEINVLDGIPGTLTATELGYVDGVTSAIQTQLNAKLDEPVHKSANYIASSGDYVVVTAGSITITLPASPSAGDYVTIKDGTGAAATTNFTVARNGSNIASSAADLTFDKNFAKLS